MLTAEQYAGMPALLIVDSAGDLHRVLAEGNYGSMKTIDIVHALLHDGKMYGHSNIHRSLAVGSEHCHILRVASGQTPHLLVPYLSATVTPIEIRLYENTQVSSLGAAAAVFNHNRSMPTSNAIAIYESAVVSSLGTMLYERSISGSGNQSGGEYTFESDEWMLIGGTTYAVGVTNKGNQVLDYSIVHKWVQP